MRSNGPGRTKQTFLRQQDLFLLVTPEDSCENSPATSIPLFYTPSDKTNVQKTKIGELLRTTRPISRGLRYQQYHLSSKHSRRSKNREYESYQSATAAFQRLKHLRESPTGRIESELCRSDFIQQRPCRNQLMITSNVGRTSPVNTALEKSSRDLENFEQISRK